MIKGYLANGLFSLGDRMVNDLISKQVRKFFPKIDLYVPQENESINNKQSFASSIDISNADLEKLKECDFLIAVLDGVEIDSGVAAEIGYFASTGKPIFGIFTDVRQQGTDNIKKIESLQSESCENQFVYRNLFVIGLVKKNGVIVESLSELNYEMVKRLKFG